MNMLAGRRALHELGHMVMIHASRVLPAVCCVAKVWPTVQIGAESQLQARPLYLVGLLLEFSLCNWHTHGTIHAQIALCKGLRRCTALARSVTTRQ